MKIERWMIAALLLSSPLGFELLDNDFEASIKFELASWLIWSLVILGLYAVIRGIR